MSDMQSTLADTRPLDRTSAQTDLRARPKTKRSGPQRSEAQRSGRGQPGVADLDLRATVVSHVIPRLHAALRSDLARSTVLPDTARTSRSDEIGAFASRMLGSDVDGACRRIEALRAAGQTLECIFLNILGPTARHLRDFWSDDACGLAEVTVALCNLQAVLRRYASPFGAERLETGGRALVLAPVPRFELNLGLPLFDAMMLAMFYRREGWQARIECDLSRPTVGAAIAGEWFDLIEILVSDEDHLDAVASTIRTIRRRSPNAAVGVIACGPICASRPDLARMVGADMTATDPLSSLAQAERWSARQIRCSREGAASRPSPRHRLS